MQELLKIRQKSSDLYIVDDFKTAIHRFPKLGKYFDLYFQKSFYEIGYFERQNMGRRKENREKFGILGHGLYR